MFVNTSSYFGTDIGSWGSGYGGTATLGYNPYTQFYQAQEIAMANANALGAYLPVTVAPTAPQPQPPVTSTECKEFAWLRKRVNEFLWK